MIKTLSLAALLLAAVPLAAQAADNSNPNGSQANPQSSSAAEPGTSKTSPGTVGAMNQAEGGSFTAPKSGAGDKASSSK